MAVFGFVKDLKISGTQMIWEAEHFLYDSCSRSATQELVQSCNLMDFNCGQPSTLYKQALMILLCLSNHSCLIGGNSASTGIGLIFCVNFVCMHAYSVYYVSKLFISKILMLDLKHFSKIQLEV